jgi:hypothetical protein
MRPKTTYLDSGFGRGVGSKTAAMPKKPDPICTVCGKPILPGVGRYRRGLESTHASCERKKDEEGAPAQAAHLNSNPKGRSQEGDPSPSGDCRARP